MSETMQALVYREYGDLSKFQIESLPKPSVGPRDVLIKVSHAGVNPVDWKLREGYIKAWPQSFPIIPGWDAAGTVVATGDQVSDFKEGQAVFSYTRPAWDLEIDGEETKGEAIGTRDGAIAQYISVPAWKVAAAPTSASLAQAAAVPLAGLTAWQGLFDIAGAAAGKSVLILGASGGVGSFAVQFAKAKGITTILGTCSSRNLEYVRELGATPIDYSAGDVAAAVRAVVPEGVDVVYDAVGGESTNAGIAALKDGGSIVSIANWGIAGLATEAKRNLTGQAFLVKPSRTQLQEIAALMDSGAVRVGSLDEIPLAEFRAAYEKSQSGRTRGKIVLNIGDHGSAASS